MGVTHPLPDFTNLNTDVPSQMANVGYTNDHSGISYQLVGATTLSGSQASITFSGIPGTYGSLQVVFMGRDDSANTYDNLYLRLNGDSGNNYDYQDMLATGTSVFAVDGIGDVWIYIGSVAGGTAPANVANSARIWLPNYAETTFQKTAFSQASQKKTNTPGAVGALVHVGYWRNTAAVTSLQLLPATGSFVAGTSASVWGLT